LGVSSLSGCSGHKDKRRKLQHLSDDHGIGIDPKMEREILRREDSRSGREDDAFA
jgi:hypothetical protein